MASLGIVEIGKGIDAQLHGPVSTAGLESVARASQPRRREPSRARVAAAQP